MSRLLRHVRALKPKIHLKGPPGTRPGVIRADPQAPPPVVRVIAYDSQSIVEQDVADLAELAELLPRFRVVWINVDGLGGAETIKTIGEMFHLHRLALEDVVNVHQRAKVEEYEDHLYIVGRMLHSDDRISTEQVSIFLGANFLLTFQERAGDCFDPVRRRLQQGKSVLRSSGPDYLAYRLLDAIVDGYFPELERYGDRLELLDDRLTTNPRDDIFSEVHSAKVDLLLLRRAIWPHREALSTLMRESTPLVTAETNVYLRDCYDHVVQLIDLVETYREICGDLRDFAINSLSNRMNEIMKVLTIISTIFIPLSFIAGLYGMNFNPERSPWNMPELNWRWGYPIVLGAMLATACAMLVFFRVRGWIGPKSRPPQVPREDR